MKKDKVVVILGPTASGKTKVAVRLAGILGGEIISADSMQVYRHMDIGTAKPDLDERCGIRHYLIDEVDPDEEFNVVRFKELSLKYIEEISAKGALPFVVGGTGLYIDSLVYNIKFADSVTDGGFRREMQDVAAREGSAGLYEKLAGIDPKAAGKIHMNDIRRIIRALEVFEHSGETISSQQERSRNEQPHHDYRIIGIAMDREILYERINRRVDMMLENGLVDEVRKLLRMGYDRMLPSMQGLGYKEAVSYLKGELTYIEMAELVKKNTRHYSKRQMTWFRKNKDIFWLNADDFQSEEEKLKIIEEYIAAD